MTELSGICGLLYRAKDQTVLIEQCANDPGNKSLSPAVLDQVQKKCGNVMPLNAARACASELGMNVTEPEQQPTPQATKHQTTPQSGPIRGEVDVTFVQSHVSPFAKCDSDYINGKINDEQYEKCIMGDLHHATEASQKIDEMHRRREERDLMTPWGRAALKIGLDVRERRSLFKDAFKDWGHGKNDGEIDKGWRPGMRVALTTEPSYTRWPGTNVLVKGTLFDFTIYDKQELGFGYRSGDSPDGLLRQPDGSYDAMDNTRWILGDVSIQIPFFEYNFLEVGASLVNEDILWGKVSGPIFIIIPGNFHMGLDWQFQGSPIAMSERLLDVTETNYMLSSYTMVGLQAEFAGVNLYHGHKAAEFCNQVSDECGEGDGIEFVAGYFPYGQADKIGANESDFSSGLEQGMLWARESTFFQSKLTAHLFGEQRWNRTSTAYRVYTDYYPTWKKVEAGTALNLSVVLGRAMEFYVEGNARKLWSTGDDNEVLLPDDAYELGISTGLGFRPWEIF